MRMQRLIHRMLLTLLAGSIHCIHMLADELEKPITILITSYNNADWYRKNLDSVLEQAYNNYHVIYVDDASTDGTADLVEDYIQQKKAAHLFTLIRSPIRCRKLEHIYRIRHTIPDWNIVIRLDGDDWFSHKQVLKKINHIYSTTDTWITYGNVICSNGYERLCPAIPPHDLGTKKGRMRVGSFHPCTSYAWLFKLIKLEDLMTTKCPGYEGKFHPASDDVAIMYPMMEMAQERCRYLKETLYIYNVHNSLSGLNSYLDLHKINSKEIRSGFTPYKRVARYTSRTIKQKEVGVDVIIVTDDPEQSTCVEYTVLKQNVQNSASIHTLNNNASREEILRLLDALASSSSGYILLMRENTLFDVPVDLHSCAQALARTQAYGFYLSISPKSHDFQTVPCQHVEDGLYAWKFSCCADRYKQDNAINASVYRTKDIVQTLESMAKNQNNASPFMRVWQQKQINPHKVGLCLEQAPARLRKD